MNVAVSSRRPSALLLLLGLALAGLVAAEILLPANDASTGSSSASAAASPVAANLRPGFSMRPLDAFSEVVERPLFRPDRRPAPAVVGTTATDGSSRQGYALLGVVINDDLRMALLRPKGVKRTLRVLEGQQIDGWVVEDVRPDRVVMRRGDVSEEVRLRDFPAAKRSKPTPLPTVKPEKAAEAKPKADTAAEADKRPDKKPEQVK